MLSEIALESVVEKDVGLTPDEEVQAMGLPKTASLDTHRYDKDPECKRHFKLVQGWWRYERIKQYNSRAERKKAHDYIDADQWDDEEKTILEERGQMPLVFNLMKATNDWLCGTERRMRYDHNVLPRKQEHSHDAEIKTKVLKYINDVNRAKYHRSMAFKDQVISGLGWRDVGVCSDPTIEPLYCRYEDWRNVWDDSCSKLNDGSDARYRFRARIVDYDIACAIVPERWDVIKLALSTQGESLSDIYDEPGLDPELDELAGAVESGLLGVGYQRNRVRLVSCEYKMPARVKVMRGKELGSLDNVIFDDKNEGMVRLVNSQVASIVDAVRMVMWRMVFCGGYVLQWYKRPFNHQAFSLVPQWCYRKKADGTPYGVAKQQMDPQLDLNKRRSKAMWHLSSNQMLIKDQNWVDYDELVGEKDRPDGTLVVKDLTQVQLRDYSKSPAIRDHVMLMEQDQRYIEIIGGVNDESKGLETNAQSGKAIQKRQEQTNISTAEIFDNALLAFQIEGEVQLSLAEQYYTEERTIRIVGSAGKYEYLDINKHQPNGEILNDITATQCDFVVDATNYTATIREKMFEQLGVMLGGMPPEIALILLDMWLDLSDLPGREAMVERVRRVSGQRDPEEDPNDPKVQARIQAEQEEAQRQKDIESMLIRLEMALKHAQAQKEGALAEKAMADARATLASIRLKVEDSRTKKALALNAIEARRHQELLPEPTTQTKGGAK